jgi:hypothetical protein
MALIVPRSVLGCEKITRIVNELQVRPLIKDMASPLAYATKLGPGFSFYETKAEFVLLPYKYGLELCQFNYNAALQTQKHINVSFLGVLREHQVEDAHLAYRHLTETGGVILNLHTGCGKTIVSTYLMCALRYVTIVLMERTSLLASWIKVLQTWTNAKIWVAGDGWVNKHSSAGKNGNQSENPIPDVIVCMDRRLDKIPVDWLSYIGVIIIDEAHHFCTEARAKLFLKMFPLYIIACTATVNKVDQTFVAIEHLCGTLSVTRKKLVGPSVYGYMTELFFDSVMSQGRLSWTAYQRSSCNSDERNDKILEIIAHLSTRKIMILTSLADHTERLESLLLSKGENVARLSGNKKSYSDSRILIGTSSKMGTGFDEANFCADFGGVQAEILIMTFTCKTDLARTQCYGRIRVEEPIIIQLIDEHPISKSHWRLAYTWAKKQNSRVLSITSPDEIK